MTSLLYYNTRNQSSKCNWVMDNISEGWPNCRIADRQETNLTPSHFWGFIENNWNHISKLDLNNVDWWFWDMPYWGRWLPGKTDKFYWRVSKNGVHPTEIIDRPNDRFSDWGLEIKPWRTEGNEILVCPSSNTMNRWCSRIDETAWIGETVNKLRDITDRPIRVRQKPRGKGTSGPAVEKLLGIPSFEKDIQNAWAVVTSVSLVAVEAVAAGVPVFCHPKSFAAPLGNLDIENIENPLMIDRQPWFNHLAYCQFTQKEIREGLAFSTMCIS